MSINSKYEVCISYRRECASVKAESLRQMLLSKGVSDSGIFMDTHTLSSGDVKPQLAEAISQSSNFLLLITDGCCDHIKEDDLWMFEIETAQKQGINMIPVFWNEKKEFPVRLSFLSSHNAVSYVHEYSDAFLQKLFSYLKHTNIGRFRIIVQQYRREIALITLILLLTCSNIYFCVKCVNKDGHLQENTERLLQRKQELNLEPIPQYDETDTKQLGLG